MACGSAAELTGDLRQFMPEAQTPAQKLLLEELGEGPGSRLLLMSRYVGVIQPFWRGNRRHYREVLAGQPQV